MKQHPDYSAIFADVKQMFVDSGYEVKNAGIPCRRLSEHTWRVFCWAGRLLEHETADAEIVRTACLLHDVGYTMGIADDHARHSARLCREYLTAKGFDADFVDRVTQAVRVHSDKHQMKEPGIAPEHLLVMEADLLDESGALGIVRTCLRAPVWEREATYKEALSCIEQHRDKPNPMATPTARRLWERNKGLCDAFIENLRWALFLDDTGASQKFSNL